MSEVSDNKHARAARMRWEAAEDLPVGATVYEDSEGRMRIYDPPPPPQTYRVAKSIKSGERIAVVTAGYAVMLGAVEPASD